MENSKLISLLKTFSPKELREFNDFLASPFFNKNEELLVLYAYLRKLAPAFPLNKLQREVVYQKAFPQNQYEAKHLNYLMSFLLKSAEEFLGIQNYRQKSHLTDYHILECMISRNLDKHYSQIYNKSMKRLEENPYRDTDFHYQQFLMRDIANQYFLTKTVRKSDHHLQDASDYFDQYYLVRKLRYTCEMLDREQIISTQFEHRLSKEILLFLEENPMDHIPAIAIYHCIYMSMTSADHHQHYLILKKLIHQHSDSFPLEELRYIIQLALNFCIRKIRHQEDIYVEEALQLYIKGIERKVLIIDDTLSHWTFKNVIKLGLRSGQFDWTEEFIYQHIDLLKPQYRQNALYYNLADLSYYKKDYELAQEQLSKVEFNEVMYALHGKVMLLKIYFENEEEEPLLALIASFKLFLRRNKVISENVREAYLNFVTALAQLTKRDKVKTQEIKKFITDTKVLTDRNWLLEILEKTEIKK